MSVTQSVTQPIAPKEDVNTTIIMAVADATGTPAEELPPLFGAVDPDALSAMFQPGCDDRGRGSIEVTFEMADCTVNIRDGEVSVTPQGDSMTASAAPRGLREN